MRLNTYYSLSLSLGCNGREEKLHNEIETNFLFLSVSLSLSFGHSFCLNCFPFDWNLFFHLFCHLNVIPLFCSIFLWFIERMERKKNEGDYSLVEKILYDIFLIKRTRKTSTGLDPDALHVCLSFFRVDSDVRFDVSFISLSLSMLIHSSWRSLFSCFISLSFSPIQVKRTARLRGYATAWLSITLSHLLQTKVRDWST